MAEVTFKYNYSSAKAFKEDIENPKNTFFMFSGRGQEWDSNSPPDTNTSLNDVELDVYKNIAYGVRITNNDILYLAPRYDWVSNTIYAEYNPYDGEIYEKNFYVIVDGIHVYKVLSNNNDSPSTIKPSFKSIVPFLTSDGYKWKYLYTVSSNAQSKFSQSNNDSYGFVAITPNTQITSSAIPGSVDYIKIINGGARYDTFRANTLRAITNSTSLVLDSGASTVDGFYTNSSIYIKASGGVGQLIEISNYSGSDKVATLSEPLLTYKVVTLANVVPVTAFKIGESVNQGDASGNIIFSDTQAVELGIGVFTTPFLVGEVVTQFNTGANGIVAFANSSKMLLSSVFGTFNDLNNIVGSYSLANAEVTSVTNKPTITVFVTSNSEFQINSTSIVSTDTGVGYISALTTTPSPTSEYIISPTIKLNGDGQGFKAYATITSSSNSIVNGSINSIYVLNSGNNYTYANVVIYANNAYRSSVNGSINSTALAYISPIFGHGGNVVEELGGKYLGLVGEFSKASDTSYYLPSYGNVHVFGLIKNPEFSRLTFYLNNYSYSTVYVTNTSGSFTNSEVVYQANIAGGIVHYSNSSAIVIKNVLGTFGANTGTSNDIITGALSQKTANALISKINTFNNPGTITTVVGNTIMEYGISYTNGSLFDVVTQQTNPRGVFFSSNGLYMYVIGVQSGGASSDDIDQYTLSVPWQVNSAVYTRTSPSLSNSSLLFVNPSDFYMKNDGSKMWVTTANDEVSNTSVIGVMEYDLTIPWNINSSSVAQTAYSVNTYVIAPSVRGIWFKSDGTRMYIVNRNNGTYPRSVIQYNLPVAWSLDGATANQAFSISSWETSPVGVVFTEDGYRMFILGFQRNYINVFDLNTAWDISTSQFKTRYYPGLIVPPYANGTLRAASPQGLYLREDGLKLYTVDDRGSANDECLIYEFNVLNSDNFYGTKIYQQCINAEATYIQGNSSQIDVSNVVGVFSVNNIVYNSNLNVYATLTNIINSEDGKSFNFNYFNQLARITLFSNNFTHGEYVRQTNGSVDIASGIVFNANKEIDILISNTSGTFSNYERIRQPSTNANGILSYVNTSFMRITDINGSFSSGSNVEGLTSGANCYVNNTFPVVILENVRGTFEESNTHYLTGNVTPSNIYVRIDYDPNTGDASANSVILPMLIRNSGEVLYIENKYLVQRTSNTAEKLQLVLKF